MSQELKKRLGVALLTMGFLYGAFVCVSDPKAVAWSRYAIGFAVTMLGVVLVRLGQRVGDEQAAEVGKSLETIVQALDRLVERVAVMNAEREQIGVFGFPERIDADCIDPINDFVDARQAVTHRYGLAVYAELMDHFALGERALNRAWCAAADGYVDELHGCLDRAEASLRSALEVVASRQQEQREAALDEAGEPAAEAS